MPNFNPGSRRPGGGGFRDPAGQGADKVADRWPNYLDGGYFDSQGNLKVEYVSRERVEPLAQKMSGLTIHQLRRYFGHCRVVETRLKAGGASWESIRPEIKKLAIAAADGAAKDRPKIPALFHDFIQRNTDAIKSRDDFLRGFLPHFEAVVGFGQGYFKKQRN